MNMEECESYEDCLNDPTREVSMEERCRQCGELTDQLITHQDLQSRSPQDADFLLDGHPVFVAEGGNIDIPASPRPIRASIDQIEALLEIMKSRKG